MAEITTKRVGELVRGVFQILLEEPEGLPAKEVIRRLERLVPPTEFEASTYPRRPNARRYDKIVRFATIAVVKAGWLIKNKGLWILTDEGRLAFEKFRDPEQFTREANRLYRAWKADRPASESDPMEETSRQAATTLECPVSERC
jgi:restriction system protein